MPSFHDARKIILQNITPLGTERVQLLESLGRIVTEDIAAPWDMPFCDTSAMDGFAVRSGDCASVPTTLGINGYMPAGGIAIFSVEAGTAVKIMTGAPIPPGCDAVVPVEETEEVNGRVIIRSHVVPRQHIRYRGADMAAGDTFLAAGTLVRPSEINLLACMGRALVPVYRRARVAILSTGDELIELGETPAIGRTIDSNALSLAASVKAIGAEPVILGIARDDRQSHQEKLEAGLLCDTLITSAGVSAGDRDLVRDVLQELGVEQLFWKIAIKPGGPSAFGIKGRTPVFSLPGNPVSTMVTFELFVKPALLKMMGHKRIIRPYVKGVLQEDAHKMSGKLNFLRVRIERENGRFLVSSAGNQHTGMLTTMIRSDALAILPQEATFIPAGSEVDLLLMNSIDLEDE